MATKHDTFFNVLLIVSIIVFFMVLIFGGSAKADWTPIGYNDWQQGNERVSDMGRLPVNYQKQDGSWEIIDTTWQSVGDTLFTCHKAVVMASAWPNGESEFFIIVKNDTIRIKRTLDRFILLDTLTWDRYDLITDIPFSNFTREGRELYWSFPGGGYRLRKGFGRTAAQVAFKPVFLDSICTIYDKLPLDSITTMVDSLYWDDDDSMVVVQVPVITTLPERVALGTVFKYEISGVSDSLLAKLTSHPGVNRKKLLKFGRRQFGITSYRLHFQGEENVREIPVLQQWRKVGGDFYLCEYLMMWQLDSLHAVWPNKSVWHGATEQVQDFSIEDTYITQSVNSVYNYGNSDDVYVGRPLADDNDTIALIRPSGDIADALGAGATVNSCSLFIYLNQLGDVGDISCNQLLKYFIEGDEVAGRPGPDPDSGATWDFFQALEFRTAGLRGFHWTSFGIGTGPDCADDNGVENVIDGGACIAANADRKATALDIVTVSTTMYYGWDIGTTLGQHWYDNGDPRGVMLWSTANILSARFTSSEVTGDINGLPPNPYIRYRYEIAEAVGQVMIVN